MDLIEQYIRKLILERDDVTTPSGYKIKILSSYYGDSDVERLRSKIINDRAQENGCTQGFMIVARKKVKTGNDAKLIDDVIDAIRANKTIMNYYDKDYRIIISQPRTIGKRKKVFAVWILDMRETSRFKQLLNRIDSIFSNPDAIRIKIPTNAKTYVLKFLTPDVDIIQQRDAIIWTNSVTGFLTDLQNNDTYSYNQILNPKDKLSVRLLNSIPDFDDMLLGVKVDDEDATKIYKQEVTIDDNWVAANFSVNFRGTAIVETSPVTGEMVVIPKVGTIYVGSVMGETRFVAGNPLFTGTFDSDGKPIDGDYYYVGTVAPAKTGDPSAFNGKLTTNLTPLLDAMGMETGDTRIEWNFINGTLFYWSPDDPEYSYFEGTFKNKLPLNGNIYQRKTTTKVIGKKDGAEKLEYVRGGYTLVGKVTGGKFKYYSKNITFPYTYNNTTYYQDPNNTDSIYAYFNEPGRWIQVPKQTFVDYAIDKEITAEIYARSVTPIVDPDLCSGLCKTFNEVDDFITIKPNSDNLVQLYIKKKVGTSTTFEFTARWRFAGPTLQYLRRIKYENETTAGYKKISLISNLSYDTSTAEFKFTETSQLPIGGVKYDIYIKETDLQ